MAILGVLVFALMTISSAETAAEETDKAVTCTATPAYVGGTATVTCHFSGGVSALLPVSLFVDFQLDGENGYGNVFECAWVDETDRCKTDTARYTFLPSTTSGDMALNISDVTLDDVGRYKCRQLSPRALHNHSESCYLSVKATDERPGSTKQPSGVREDVDDSITTERPSDVTSTSETPVLGKDNAGDDTAAMDVGLIVVYVLVPTVVVLIILTGVICFVRRKRRPESLGQQPNREADETLKRRPESLGQQPNREADETLSSPPTRDEEEPLMEDPQHPSVIQPEQEAPAAEKAEHSAESAEDESGSDSERADLRVENATQAFRDEIKIKAAVLQIPIKRKLSTGDYP